MKEQLAFYHDSKKTEQHRQSLNSCDNPFSNWAQKPIDYVEDNQLCMPHCGSRNTQTMC